MITQRQADRIRDLRAEGKSEREIAKEAGVARGTVRRVLAEKGLGDVRYCTSDVGVVRAIPNTNLGRCSLCGALVALPCFECRTTLERDARRAARKAAAVATA